MGYSAKHGTLALDGEKGKMSPFAQSVIDYIEEPKLDIRLFFGKVRDAVLARTGGQQEPWTYGSLPGELLVFKD